MPELSVLHYIFIFTFLGSLGSLIGGVILMAKEKFAIRVSHFLASFAAGTLLGTAFFDLLPEAGHLVEEAHENGGVEIDIFLWTLIGILLFFIIQRFIHWFHDHDDFHPDQKERKSTIPLVIFSDTLHNFLDGVVISATFLVSIPLGIVTTLAVIAHEVPHEIGDFGLLLHKGMKRRNVIWVNVFSAGVSFLGAGITYIIGDSIEKVLPIFLALTAGFFIYIAASDIIPEIHLERRRRHAIFESILLLVGVGMTYIAISFLHQGH